MGNSTWAELVSSMPDEPELDNGLHALDPLQKYEHFIRALHHVVMALESKPPAEEVMGLLDEGVNCLMATSEAADATLFVLDELSRELHFVIVKGSVPADKLKWRQLPRGYGIAGWVAENGKHVVSNEIGVDSRFCSWFDDELDYKTKTVLAVPILSDGRVLGVIELLNKGGTGLFTNADAGATVVFANICGQVLNDLASRGEKTTA